MKCYTYLGCYNVQTSKIPKSTLSENCQDGFSFYLIFSIQTVPYMDKAVNFPQYEYGDQKKPSVTAGYDCLGMVMFEYGLTFYALHASSLSSWPYPEFTFCNDRPAVVKHRHSARITESHQIWESKGRHHSRAHAEYVLDIRHRKVHGSGSGKSAVCMYSCFLQSL